MAEVDDAELTALRADAQRAGQLEGELASLREAGARELRAAVLVAHPELPEQLVVGSTAAELEASVASAMALVESIRERTLGELRGLASGKPPMGFRPAPPSGGGRGPLDLSGMTAAQKIRAGLDAREKAGG
jgi:hypothetical protein